MGPLYVAHSPLFCTSRELFPASIILMLTIGVVLLVVFGIWDLRYASLPVITPAFVRNRSVGFASLIGCFDFVGLLTMSDEL